jgi:uncharacterized lipoprotein
MEHTKWMGGVMLMSLVVALSACASHPETASPEFGGQPKDQAARERHHPQYPESARHLGPQQDGSSVSDTDKSQEQLEAERAAVSGVGR